ncbi:MAG: hypothetical protein HY329_19375 [Chloroflexi bacterium]|nr:hypothetical protein [Chloroflexota bacterium]
MTEREVEAKISETLFAEECRCPNRSCALFEVKLEPDEIEVNVSTGVALCAQCGQPLARIV